MENENRGEDVKQFMTLDKFADLKLLNSDV